MIDIHEARRVARVNMSKPPCLLKWVESYIDEKIMDAASHGHYSLCLRFSRFDKMSDEETEAVLEAYADYSPKHYCKDGENTFYFFWD